MMDDPHTPVEAAIVSARIQLQSLEVLASIDTRLEQVRELLERLVTLLENRMGF
jgi:hypothetical protein